MGKLTDDMTRLRGEIQILRGSRTALMQELTRGAIHLTDHVATMISNFATDHIMKATKAKEERKTFVFSMIREVDTLLEDFCRGRENRARIGRENRGRFLLDMRKQVNDLRKDMSDDLTGARLAWRGPLFRKSKVIPSKKGMEGLATMSPKEKERGGKTRKSFQESTLTFKEGKHVQTQ